MLRAIVVGVCVPFGVHGVDCVGLPGNVGDNETAEIWGVVSVEVELGDGLLVVVGVIDLEVGVVT